MRFMLHGKPWQAPTKLGANIQDSNKSRRFCPERGGYWLRKKRQGPGQVVQIEKPAYEMGVRIAQIILLAGLCIMTGCKATYKQSISNPTPEFAPLRSNTRVYIAMPEDAIDKKEPVPMSGRRTAVALETAFRRQTRAVAIGRIAETLAEAIKHARENSCEYIVFPTIVKWHDRATEWTGVRDSLKVRVDLVAVETGEVVRSSTIAARSKFMTDGEDAPQDLLADPMDKFARALFRISYTPSALP